MNSYLSQAGIAARRKSDKLIKDGSVTVNGRVVLEPGLRIVPCEDEVKFNNVAVHLKKKNTYILLNKPKGVVCTVNDDKNRETIFDLVKSDSRLFSVGRLDLTTTGLLLLTDDGTLSFRLTHPKYEIDKVYRVALHKSLTQSDNGRLETGIEISRKEKVSARVDSVSSNGMHVTMVVHEGRKNMIRRMVDQLGYKVESLDRIEFAGLTKYKLPKGGWRYLSQKEITKLHRSVGLPFQSN